MVGGISYYAMVQLRLNHVLSNLTDLIFPLLDYFHIGGDDLYLIVENLRLYLESEEIRLASNGGHYLPNGSEDTQTPLFLGRRFAEGGNRDTMFISGGSGYTMNKGMCFFVLSYSTSHTSIIIPPFLYFYLSSNIENSSC